MLNMEGNIFDIQRFSVHDGPGIRTTVFFKGCPLNCVWCHNPESHKSSPELAYYGNRCVGCGACAKVCPSDCHSFNANGGHVLLREGCILCGKCAEACPYGALEILGRRATVSSVIEEVLRDAAFYKNSGGGMTVSGGEPLMQSEFLIELLKEAKRNGIHTCLETSGFASQEVVREAAKQTDIFLFDIKATDDRSHEELTGVPFEPIKKNLFLLDSLGKKIILRCPLVPAVNTDSAHIERLARIAASLDNLIEVNVMAYHILGSGKYGALGMKNEMEGRPPMSKEEKEECVKKISEAIRRISERDIKVC